MYLHLGGHLGWYDPQKRSRLEIHVSEPTHLLSLLERLKIPVAEVAVVTVNRQAVDLGSVSVTDVDRVELFPPIGGGAA